MLETHNRQLFLETVRPPGDYELDFLIGTTYSLDLVTLLTLPLTFTLFDAQDESGKPLMDPLVLLEALRLNADKMSIFCQAGEIYLPKQHRGLFTYLEHSVHEVVPPSEEGVFHPKVWIGRYIRRDSPVRYKVMVQSRNLTFDKSWDVMTCLDGEVLNRQNAIARNHPLADFVQKLPDLTVRSLNQERAAKLELIQYELRRLDLNFPEGVEDIKFHLLGIKGHHAWPFAGRIDRMLVVSPFLTGSCLENLAVPNAENILVTRQESLASIEAGELTEFHDDVYVLMDGATPEAMDELDDAGEGSSSQISMSDSAGLHAKVYVADEGWNARIWLGSANATHNAFHKNVEFLIEMRGKKRLLGVQSVLGKPDDRWSLSRLLKPYHISDDLDLQETVLDSRNELEQLRRVIAVSDMALVVEPAGGEEMNSQSGFDVTLRLPGYGSRLPSEAHIACRPISLPDTRYQSVSISELGHTEVKFSGLTMDALTSFIAFRITKAGAMLEFVSNVKMEGEPESRRDRILKSLLTNKAEVFRYILLLLSEGDDDPITQALLNASRESSTAATLEPYMGMGTPLLESILKILHSNPKKLEQIQNALEQLKSNGREDLLPEGFLDVWNPIWTVAEEVLLHS